MDDEQKSKEYFNRHSSTVVKPFIISLAIFPLSFKALTGSAFGRAKRHAGCYILVQSKVYPSPY